MEFPAWEGNFRTKNGTKSCVSFVRCCAAPVCTARPKTTFWGYFPCSCCESLLSFTGITASLVTGSTLIYANNCECFTRLWGSEGDRAAAGLQVRRRRRMLSIPGTAGLAVPVLGLCRGCAGARAEDALPSD